MLVVLDLFNTNRFKLTTLVPDYLSIWWNSRVSTRMEWRILIENRLRGAKLDFWRWFFFISSTLLVSRKLVVSSSWFFFCFDLLKVRKFSPSSNDNCQKNNRIELVGMANFLQIIFCAWLTTDFQSKFRFL